MASNTDVVKMKENAGQTDGRTDTKQMDYVYRY